jgi:leucyl aminopeptidase
MKFSIAGYNDAATSKTSDAWVCAVDETGSTVAKGVQAQIKQLAASGDFKGKKGSSCLVLAPSALSTARLVLVGTGTAEETRNPKTRKQAATKAAQVLLDTPAKHAVCWTSGSDGVAAVALAIREAAYRYGTTKSKKPDPVALEQVTLLVPAGKEQKAREALRIALGTADGIELTRELANLPGNYCTPTYLGQIAKQLGKEKSMSVEVLERKEIEKLGMGSFLSVTNGSAQPPRFIVLQYQGAAKSKAPHVLVGKGITFDTGGISIKPSAEMDEMKYDMGGAASVLGTFKTLSVLKPKVNVVGLIPTCENMPSGTATKPGDVVTSMSGQTIEVLNTDAEGRLILCDALTYAERFKPAAVIDLATLTGAIVIALGAVNSGLFSNDDSLANSLIKAGDEALDPCWRMPLQDEYDDALKSNFADMANIGGRAGGSITAAMFLKRFTKNLRWAHLDIAATAWKSGAAKGATGRPVSLLVNYLLAQQK